MFSVCQFTQGEGGTPSPSHNTSTGAMSFPGSTQSLVGVPQSHMGKGTPGWQLSPPSHQDWGTSTQPERDGIGIPSPQPGLGYAPPPFSRTGYAAGSMPQEDCLLSKDLFTPSS